MTVQWSADVEHPRRAQFLRDGLIGNDNDPEGKLLRYICSQPLCLVCAHDLSQVRPGGYRSTMRCSPKHSPGGLHSTVAGLPHRLSSPRLSLGTRDCPVRRSGTRLPRRCFPMLAGEQAHQDSLQVAVGHLTAHLDSRPWEDALFSWMSLGTWGLSSAPLDTSPSAL